MPNWCDTTYRVVGEKEKVKKFYDLAMKSWNGVKNDKHPNAGNGWLGTFVDLLDGPEDAYARGWMRCEPELSNDGCECTFYCDTAWSEPYQWREFIQSKLDVSIYYIAIEPGCGIYLSNDDEYIDKYYVDATPEQPDCPYMTEDELCDFLTEHYQAQVTNADECIEFANSITDSEGWDEDLFINLIEYSE
jgi:hypothetical protein